MEQPVEKRGFAWQPLTPSGMAAFARAPLGHLLLVQLVIALFAASSLAWFLHRDWFPTIAQAIHQLPDGGEIRSGHLEGEFYAPKCLAENRFMALVVDLKHAGQVRSPAHVAIEFGETDLKIFSLLGFVQAGYPAGWRIAFNRSRLEPWWGAWSPALLAMVIALVTITLMSCWAVMATLYFLPAWLVAFFANRELGLAASWRVAGAALMPGAVFLAAGICLYGFAMVDLIGLLVSVAIHFVLGWLCLFLALSRLPQHQETIQAKANPFAVK